MRHNLLLFAISPQNMYNNANKVIKNKRARAGANSTDQHKVAMAMIKQNTKRNEGTMVNSINPLKEFSDNIAIPDAEAVEDADKKKSSGNKSTVSGSGKGTDKDKDIVSPPSVPTPVISPLMRSRGSGRRSGVVSVTVSTDDKKPEVPPIPVVDRLKVAQWINKVTEAELEAIPEWEIREDRKREEKGRLKMKKKRMQNVSHSHYAIKVLEGKLTKSIKFVHAEVRARSLRGRNVAATQLCIVLLLFLALILFMLQLLIHSCYSAGAGWCR